MMTSQAQGSKQLISTLFIFSLCISIVIIIAIPLQHLYNGHKTLMQLTQQKARYMAEDISEFVFKNAASWHFQEIRYIAIINRFSKAGIENIQLISNKQKIIYNNNIFVEKPFITVSDTIYDSHIGVAHLQIQVSYRQLVMQTFYALLASCLLGLACFMLLFNIPMKSLKRATRELSLTQNTLQDEILSKEKALDEASNLSQRMHEMAIRDSLTGLANRSMFSERLSQAILRAQRHDGLLAVVSIDINQFKQINDSLGHQIGDMILVEISHRLQASVRKTDTVARLGGDEFALLLDIEKHNQAVNICSKLAATINNPVMTEQQTLEINCSASFGLSFFPDHGNDPAILLQKSDIAMYAAKRTSTLTCIYDKKIDMHTPEKLRLASQMGKALINNEFFLVFQPKINLQSMSVCGVEALARWEHPSDGLISPGVFIPLAESSDFVTPFTDWVIDNALQLQSQWKQQGIHLDVSVNISAKNLRDENLHHKLAIAMQRWDTTADELILEITESAMIEDPQHAQSILKEISDMGVRLSIDDFGTGHASLVQLKSFPFSELKIDQSFVKDMICDQHDAAIVRSAIALAKSLNMKVVAEGIEDRRCIAQLVDMGCDIAQGYYYCKPLQNDLLIDWVKNNDIAKLNAS